MDVRADARLEPDGLNGSGLLHIGARSLLLYCSAADLPLGFSDDQEPRWEVSFPYAMIYNLQPCSSAT